MSIRHMAVAGGLALGLMSGTARAAYVVNVTENSAARITTLSGSGSLNLSGLSFSGTAGTVSGVNQANGYVVIGQDSNADDVYTGITGPAFGPLQAFLSSRFGRGASVGVDAATGRLFVTGGYVSGADLGQSTLTYFVGSRSDIFPSAGSYTWELPNDTFTVNVLPVPLPASAAMFGASLLALASLGYAAKRKRMTSAA